MSVLDNIIQEIKNELMQNNKIRDETHESMRKATSLSKQSILLSHRKKLDEAQSMLADAQQRIAILQKMTDEYPDIVYGGMFSAAMQEYAEGRIFLTLIQEKRFPTPKEVNVPSVEYVLGLADVIGEFRRLALDKLREGEVEQGEKCLETMDQIFIQLLALDEAYMLVPGLRHKSDSARRIIEATRGDITLEVRRKSLEDTLKLFSPSKKVSRRKSKVKG